MGKNLIQQARGKGSPTYRAPSFRYKGIAAHKKLADVEVAGIVVDIIHCQGHSTPLMKVKYEDGDEVLSLIPEGVAIGDSIMTGPKGQLKPGNTMQLQSLPEGTQVFNIESNPGDGGKFARSSGSNARIVGKLSDKVTVEMPSKKQKQFSGKCRATVGVIAAGGRLEKPLLKAGHAFYKYKAKNKLWPKVAGTAQNAVDHPFGNKRSSRKSKARPISKNAPPGRKVGQVGARRTGQRKR